MAQTNDLKVHFLVTGVNLKSAASTLFFAAMTGKKFIPRALFCKIATRTGTGTLPTVKVGNGGTWEASNSATLGTSSHIAGEIVEMALNGTSRMFAFDIGTTGISVTVTGASTYTTHTADFWLEGYLV